MHDSSVFAIVDIETTGGYAGNSGITEIAIFLFDGKRIIDTFESLVNPRRPIPLHITALTGITNDMVASAPYFEDIAYEVYRLLVGKIFVAHHVNFDYSFVKNHLERSGYNYSANKLCTVRLYRKFLRGLPSYSLGRLCDKLGIENPARHRAGGDAHATTLLFKQIFDKHRDGVMDALKANNRLEAQLPPQITAEQVRNLPNSPGVYYFHDKKGKILYVGKAKNIKKRVLSHFTGHNVSAQRQAFLRNIYDISHQCCGTELMALLMECAAIKKHWPSLNRSLKRFEPKYALYQFERQDGYLQLTLGNWSKWKPVIREFFTSYEGVRTLNRLIQEHELHPRYCHYGTFAHSAKFPIPPPPQEDEAHEPNPETYNERVYQAVAKLELEIASNTFLIVDRGYEASNFSCILVENGQLYGLGHVDEHCDFHALDDIREQLERVPSNQYSMQLIYQFAERYPQKVWRPQQNISMP